MAIATGDGTVLPARPRRVEARLEGAPEDGGAVRLDELQLFLQHWFDTLRAFEKEIEPDEAPQTVFRVVHLAYVNPATVAVEAVPEGAGPDRGPVIVSEFLDAIEIVNEGGEPEGLEYHTLEMLRNLATPYRRHLAHVTFSSNGKSVPLEPDFATKVERLLAKVFRTHGSFRGRLDAVNLHGSKCSAFIYPLAAPGKVRCTFPKGRFSDIGSMLERVVEVFGVLHFRADSAHPYQIEAEDIRALPLPSDLPSANDIVGSMPNVLEGKDIATYLRELRDETEAA